MKTTLSTRTALALAVAMTLGTGTMAVAQTHADHDHSTPEGMQQHMQLMQQHMQLMQQEQQGKAAGQHEAEALVRKVDPAAGKITLRHGAIPGMGMGAMTMAYAVKDKAMLDGLKAGDKVRFAAEKVDGSYIVTRIEKAE